MCDLLYALQFQYQATSGQDHAWSPIACALSHSVLLDAQWSSKMAVNPAINHMHTENADSIMRKGTSLI